MPSPAPPEHPVLLALRGVRRRLGGSVVLDGLDLEVRAGEVLGLLGPNGAGKTTLVRLILGLMQPDAGTVSILGATPEGRPRVEIGYLPEERGLYPKVSLLPLLTYLVSLHDLALPEARRRARAWLERVGLGGRLHDRADTLSKGLQQKVQLGAAVLHDPAVLILDEPFTGLDPIGRRLVAEVVSEARARGAAVLVSTHLLDQVEQLCDRVLLVHRGRRLLGGPVEEVRARHGAGRVRLTCAPRARARLEAALAPAAETLRPGPDEATLEVRLREGVSPRALIERALESGVEIRSFGHVRPTLEAIFVQAVRDAGGVAPAEHGASSVPTVESPRP